MRDKRTIEILIVGILLACSSALILSHLGNIYLWQDEAQTALISKTILTHQVPVGYDGTNYFSQLKGAEYGKDYVWKWHPWLPFYVLAGFFAGFGTSTFVARLAFALFGIGTIILTYFCGKSLWKVRRVGVLAAVVLLTSVPFLILVRQCRYYAPMMLFSVAGLYAYTGILERRKYGPTAFLISGVLLFHSHPSVGYVARFVNGLSVTSHASRRSTFEPQRKSIHPDIYRQVDQPEDGCEGDDQGAEGRAEA